MTLYEKRRQKLKQEMKNFSVDHCFFFHYTQIAYFTGCHLGDLLWVPIQGEPIVFTRKVEPRMKSFHSEDLKVIPYRSYKDLNPLILEYALEKIAIPLEMTSYTQVHKFLDALNLSPLVLIDAQPLMNLVTLIKTTEEVALIQKANHSIACILKDLKPEECLGKTEAHISGLLYSRLRDIGFIGEYQFRSLTPFTGPAVLTKDSIYTAGSTSTTYAGQGLNPILATGSGQNTIEQNIPFIIDIMNNQDGLFADVTRTFIIGKPSKKLQERYSHLLQIDQFIQKECQVGVSFTHIYEKTLALVDSLGYTDHFMGLKPDQAPFIGHNIGAWVDELPAFSKNMPQLLQPNMTFALEPKLYFKDFDSPGLESTFVQKEDGIECLTPLSNQLIIL